MFLKTLYLSNIFVFGYIFLKNRKLFFENGFKHTPFLLQFKMKSKGECRAKCQTIEGNVGHGPNSTLILIPFLLAPEVNWKPRLKTKEVHSLFFFYWIYIFKKTENCFLKTVSNTPLFFFNSK